MKYLLTIVLLFSFNQVMAEYYLDGDGLLKKCEMYNNAQNNDAISFVCPGYIMGVADEQKTLTYDREMKPYWCVPVNASAGQLVRIVTKHLQENPKDLHLSASGLVSLALIDAFPCE